MSYDLRQVLVEVNPEIDVSLCGPSDQEVLQALASNTYSLVLLEVESPDFQKIELIEMIARQYLNVRILAYSLGDGVLFVKDLILNRVSGIVFNANRLEELAEVAGLILDGMTYYCSYAERVSAQIRRMNGKKNKLTERELDVIRLIAEGKNTNEIAHILNVTANTVDTHRRHLLVKLGARNVAHLVMIGIAKGL